MFNTRTKLFLFLSIPISLFIMFVTTKSVGATSYMSPASYASFDATLSGACAADQATYGPRIVENMMWPNPYYIDDSNSSSYPVTLEAKSFNCSGSGIDYVKYTEFNSITSLDSRLSFASDYLALGTDFGPGSYSVRGGIQAYIDLSSLTTGCFDFSFSYHIGGRAVTGGVEGPLYELEELIPPQYAVMHICYTKDDPPSATISANCTRVRVNSASDPQGSTSVNIYLNGSYIGNAPSGGTISIPNSYKTYNTVSVTGTVLNNGSRGSALNQPTNSVTIGPCDGRPSGSVTATCVVGSGGTITVTGSDDQDDSTVNPAGYIIQIEHNGSWEDIANVNNNVSSYSITFPDKYKDAFSRQVRAILKNRGARGDNTAYRTTTAEATAPRCNVPTCNDPTTIEAMPEVNTDFGVKGSFNYNPVGSDASKMRRVYYYARMGVPASSINAGPYRIPASGSNTSSNPPPGTGNSTEITPPFKITTVGTYAITYELHYGNNGSALEQFVLTCTDNNAAEIARYPYYKIYNNDAQAGGVFKNGNTCDVTSLNTGATFRGFNIGGDDTTLNPAFEFTRGAGAQLGLFAMGTIQEVSSASLRPFQANNLNLGGSGAKLPTRETFRNFSGGVLSNSYGGDSGIYRCIPDWYTKVTSEGATDSGPTIAATTLAPSQKIIRYHTGDVTITGNIAYSGLTDAATAPNFTLVVKGNIRINSNVTQLDGTYIAQPDASNTGGQIYTCYTTLKSDLNGACQNKLTVNGALIAKKVIPWRTVGTLNKYTSTTPSPPPLMTIVMADTAAQRPAGMDCVSVADPSGEHGDWNNNYICFPGGKVAEYGITWHINGPSQVADNTGNNKSSGRNRDGDASTTDNLPAGTICTPLHEALDINDDSDWNNNYLCIKKSANIVFSFFHGGPDDPRPLTGCTGFAGPGITWDGDPSDPHTWASDNYLCQTAFAPPATAVPEYYTDTNLAESFRFGPEIYLNPNDPPATPNPKKYDFITTLPPVF